MLSLKEGLDKTIFGLQLSGEFTMEDCLNLVQLKMATSTSPAQPGVKLWLEWDKQFKGFSIQVLMDDTLLSWFHSISFYRIALISPPILVPQKSTSPALIAVAKDQDIDETYSRSSFEQLQDLANLLTAVADCSVRVYDNDQSKAATAWLNGAN